MITAKEAREITNSSDLYLDKFLGWLEIKIKEEATKGNTFYNYYGSGTGDTTKSDAYHIREFYSHGFPVPPMWQRIITKTKSLGYGAITEKSIPTEKPRHLGMDDDSDDWKNWVTYYIKFSW